MPSLHRSPLLPQRAMHIHSGYLGSAKQNWMQLKMNWIGSLLLGMALASCGLSDSRKGSSESALYDPVTVTLKPSVRYQFVEGELEGRGQKFHSQYSYERAVIIGNKNYNW
jgi:hypothetical protein